MANLTPEQIEEVYYRPAKEAESQREEPDGGKSVEDFPVELGLIQFAEAMLAQYPASEYPESTREKWERDWRLAEEERISREGK